MKPDLFANDLGSLYIVGYCPRYLNSEIFEVLLRNSSFVEVRVEQVNQMPTPLQSRLLCNITAQGSNDFRPFSSHEYQPCIVISNKYETI